MIKRFARLVLAHELKSYDRVIDEQGTALRIMRDEINNYKTQEALLRKQVEKMRIEHGNMFEHVTENISEWEKIKGLIDNNVFKSLTYFMLDEIETTEQEISSPDDVHKFWYTQGAKYILRQMLDYSNVIKQKILYFAGKKKEPVLEEKNDSPSYD